MMVSIIPECWRYPREMSECLLQTLLLANWLGVTSAEQRGGQNKPRAMQNIVSDPESHIPLLP